jgi:hypothetical protein
MELKFNFRLLPLLRHIQEKEKIIISLSLSILARKLIENEEEDDVSLSQESILCSLREYDDDSIGLYTNKRVMNSRHVLLC